MIKLLVQSIDKSDVCQVYWQLESHKSIHVFINPDKPRSEKGYLYWRLADNQGTSLLNIDIDYNGHISMIEVILYKHPIFLVSDDFGTKVKKEFGNIAVDTSPWDADKKHLGEEENRTKYEKLKAYLDGKFIDNPKSFNLQINKKDMRIELFEDLIQREIWISDSLCFELNELGEICAIVLDGFMKSHSRKLKRMYRIVQ